MKEGTLLVFSILSLKLFIFPLYVVFLDKAFMNSHTGVRRWNQDGHRSTVCRLVALLLLFSPFL